jgi:hypothetical protein
VEPMAGIEPKHHISERKNSYFSEVFQA